MAVACSGGIDSTLLLHACRLAGVHSLPVFIDHPGVPAADRQAAERLVTAAAGRRISLSLAELQPVWGETRVDRCYRCKRTLFSRIRVVLGAAGYATVPIADGTHADDDPARRPGMRALAEMGVFSPLRACGWRKDDIRRQARAWGLTDWNRPARACLAIAIDGPVDGPRLTLIAALHAAWDAVGIGRRRVLLAPGRLTIGAAGDDAKRALAVARDVCCGDDDVRFTGEIVVEPLSGGTSSDR
jgi:uncharacterized protein